MADQELRLRITQTGAEQVAENLRGVQGAQQGVAASAAQAGTAASAAAPKIGGLGEAGSTAGKGVEELEAELRNFFATIPGGERLTRIIRLMNALGDGTVSVGGALRTGSALLSKFSGSLMLLAAAGAVVAGIVAISSALRSIGEEARRNEEAIKRQTEALNELIKKNREVGQSIEDVASQRPQGGFTAAQAEAASQTAADIRQRLPFISESTLAEVLGIFGGASEREGGGARSREELERIAILAQQKRIELDPKKSSASVDAALQRFAEQIAIDMRRELEQVTASAEKAKRQSLSFNGPTVDLDAFVRRSLGPDTPQTDIDAIVALVRLLPNPEDVFFESKNGLPLGQGWAANLFRFLEGGNYISGLPVNPQTGEKTFVDSRMLALTETVLQRLNTERPGITYNQQGMRVYGPDTESRRRRTVNGETAARDAERIGG